MSRAVVVGAGPSGFYAADQLLTVGFEVDLLDALPTPFGLVRSGVAPDHPKIKTVTRVYTRTAARPGFRFFGGVVLGEHVARRDLLARYEAVVYAVGASTDRRLGIPGEGRPGSHAATRFVAWYNGHPSAADDEFELSGERAVVIGNGNVAIDVARMLARPAAELARTDTAEHAIAALRDSAIREVVILGRRGPAQASFTTPELRELAELESVGVAVDPGEVELDEPSRAWLGEHGSPTARRNVEMLQRLASTAPKDAPRRIALRFLRTPTEILGDGANGPVAGVRVAVNRLDRAGRAVPTGAEEIVDCDLVFRSIGYRGVRIDDVPFCEASGIIANEGGRVVDEEGRVQRGEYVVGWIKRGPSGIIGTNKKDAAETVAQIVADVADGALNVPTEGGDGEDVAAVIAERAPNAVTWLGWEAIDAAERAAGEPHGRPRVKFVRQADFLKQGQSFVEV